MTPLMGKRAMHGWVSVPLAGPAAEDRWRALVVEAAAAGSAG